MAEIRSFMGLTKRNMLVFFTDKGTLFFSMLTPMIILLLYILFLKNNLLSSLQDAATGLGSLISANDMDQFVNSLLLTGIISSALITIPYNALEIMVRDREDRVDLDMLSTPVKRFEIILSYFCASVVSAFMQTMIVLTFGITVLSMMGDMYLAAGDVAKLVLSVLLGTISSTAVFMVVMMIFKSMGTCGAFMGILSAISGFVIGAYMPLSQFSRSIQNVCNLVPATGITVLIRNYLTGGILRHMNECIGGLDGGAFMEAMLDVFSYNTVVGGEIWTLNLTWIYVIISTVIFLGVVRVVYPAVYGRR